MRVRCSAHKSFCNYALYAKAWHVDKLSNLERQQCAGGTEMNHYLRNLDLRPERFMIMNLTFENKNK